MTVATDITLSPDQSTALDAIHEWYKGQGNQSFTIAGYAGTGKTTILNEVTARIINGQQVIYAAYTGKAAHVMRSKLPAGSDVRTLHSLLYKPRPIRICTQTLEKLVGFQCMPHRKQRPDDCPWREEITFQLKLNNDERPALIVVDEASMVSHEIQMDLLDLGVPVLFTGDHGQLPPVQSTGNVMEYPDVKLEKIHRQAEGNPIILASKIAREEGYLKPGTYGDGRVVKMTPEQFRDVNKSRLDAAKAVILCGMNRTRAAVNRAGAGDDGVTVGTPVVILRNDYDLGLMNGMRGEVTQYHKRVDNRVMIDVQFEGEERPRTLMAYSRIFGTEKVPDGVERDYAWMDYAYAMTVHKSQGSQWRNVVLIEERLPGNDHNRWLYTGITRASDALLIVGD
jgi:exodeoxyribonuclease-5